MSGSSTESHALCLSKTKQPTAPSLVPGRIPYSLEAAVADLEDFVKSNPCIATSSINLWNDDLYQWGDLRCLVDSANIGRYIGIEGGTIAGIREATGVTASFLSQVPNAQERVLVIRGTAPQQVAAICGLVWAQLVASDDSGSSQSETASVSFKLLIDEGHAGPLIGKSGATIRAMQMLSSSFIQVRHTFNDSIVCGGWAKSIWLKRHFRGKL